jgi:heme O synthase-like polyprenyltransferase
VHSCGLSFGMLIAVPPNLSLNRTRVRLASRGAAGTRRLAWSVRRHGAAVMGLSVRRLSRPTRVRVIVGAVLPLSLGTFLVYAGVAVANLCAGWANAASSAVGSVVRVAAFTLWLLLVFGLPIILGGLIGAGVDRMRIREGGA